MIFSNVSQSSHNNSQDNHKFLSINSLKWQKQIASWTVVILMQLIVMCLISAIALLIGLDAYFLDTPQWDFFLFLTWDAIKYSSQMIFLTIFDLFMPSSFNCSMIFNKGKLLISQHNFTTSAIFLQLLLLFQALF